ARLVTRCTVIACAVLLYVIAIAIVIAIVFIFASFFGCKKTAVMPMAAVFSRRMVHRRVFFS
ncbi:hypothetical protein, partial [Thiolapillus sp.]|uniref:hypothetical protein n=1 Tax=Thiolapillus sp. TaxID=2017437 RepID=UPI003AF45456